MKMIKKIAFLVFFLLGMTHTAWATHNRAGEITFKHISGYTYEITIHVYAKINGGAGQQPPDRPSLPVNWGDGTSDTVSRVNGLNNAGVDVGNNVRYNQYTKQHTYSGQGTFKVSTTDQNRINDILNLNPPNSSQVAFHIETTIFVLNPQYETNSSPVLLQSPIDIGYVNQVFLHNPNAYDNPLENDSLSYELITPRANNNAAVPNYNLPSAIGGNASNNRISINAVTGTLTWDSPKIVGEYSVAILIREYRNGRLISSMIRDMQITIKTGNNRPPVIETKDELCVIAGQRVSFEVKATDPDIPQQLIKLSATGGPLIGNPVTNPTPATFPAPTGYTAQPVIVQFTWDTKCVNIREQYYQLVFNAVDNYGVNDVLSLSTLKTVRIRVVAPPPTGLLALGAPGKVALTWDKPYGCDMDKLGARFRGFNIWRQEGCKPLTIDTCGTDLAAQGYTRIARNITTATASQYFYNDVMVQRGQQYTYVIEAEIGELNGSGTLTNIVQSLPSDRKCVQVARDLPLMTNVDIRTTSTTTGEIFVQWSKPSTKDLDTLLNPGPYQYILYRADGLTGGTYTKIWQSVPRQYFKQAKDTMFTDLNRNTQAQPYHYKVTFMVRGTDTLGTNVPASSHYLKVTPSDHQNTLNWESSVPWADTLFEIYREGLPGAFTLIGTSLTPTYVDTLLQNNKLYCYKIRAIGTYSTSSILNPLFNWSQIACASPIDNVPPCPPKLAVSNDCATAGETAIATALKNLLTWRDDNDTYICRKNNKDIAKYNVYYAKTKNSPYTLIATVDNHATKSFIHEGLTSIAGCYYVTAIDSAETPLGGNNESAASNIFCVDNCPYYELPNVFTPNGDGLNDTYTPFIPWRFVSRIDIQIFNRWGGLVYHATDPKIDWKGTDLNDKELAEGAYFYKCEVFEERLEGEVKREKALSGFIQLIRND
jgi:gliding motility-associated-like protein